MSTAITPILLYNFFNFKYISRKNSDFFINCGRLITKIIIKSFEKRLGEWTRFDNFFVCYITQLKYEICIYYYNINT